MTPTLHDIFSQFDYLESYQVNELIDAVNSWIPKVEELTVDDIEIPLDSYAMGFSTGVEITLTEIQKKLK